MCGGRYTSRVAIAVDGIDVPQIENSVEELESSALEDTA